MWHREGKGRSNKYWRERHTSPSLCGMILHTIRPLKGNSGMKVGDNGVNDKGSLLYWSPLFGCRNFHVQSSTSKWYTTGKWYTFVELINSVKMGTFLWTKFYSKLLHITCHHSNFERDWMCFEYRAPFSKLGILWILPKPFPPLNDTELFWQLFNSNLTKSSEILAVNSTHII